MSIETKIEKLIIESGVGEREFHDYANNSKEELDLLLIHHEEDLKEYIARGDDAEDIAHVREDIREIEDELKTR